MYLQYFNELQQATATATRSQDIAAVKLIANNVKKCYAKSYVLQDFSIFRRQFRANWLTILDYIAQIGGGAFSQIDFDIFVKLKKFSKLRAGGGREFGIVYVYNAQEKKAG